MTRATLAVCVPIHLRGASADHLAPAMKRLRQLNSPVLLCGSEGDHSQQQLAKYCKGKVRYTEVPQGPVCTDSSGDAVLRAKFNDSLSALVKQAPKSDWYCLVGANDVVSLGFYKHLKFITHPKAAICGVASHQPLYLSEGWRVSRCVLSYQYAVQMLPGINAFNRQALEVFGGAPYCVPGCEVGLEREAAKRGVDILQLSGVIWSIKDGINLNSIQHIARHHQLRQATYDEAAAFSVWFGELY